MASMLGRPDDGAVTWGLVDVEQMF